MNTFAVRNGFIRNTAEDHYSSTVDVFEIRMTLKMLSSFLFSRPSLTLTLSIYFSSFMLALLAQTF